MPYRICKTIEIENGHMLSKHPDKCRFPHGHTRKVEVVLEAAALDTRDMVCDFKALKELMEEFLERYDHAICVNTDDPQYASLKAANGERVIAFESIDPTTEVMARTIFEHLQHQLRDRIRRSDARYPVQPEVRLTKVRLWETSNSWAEYAE